MWTVETFTDETNHVIQDSIHYLSDNSIGAIRIPGIYNDNELDTIIENIERQGVLWYPNFEFRQGRIGIGATEYASKINGKLAYFLLEPESSKIRDKIFPESLDPVSRMEAVFSQAFDTSVAEEPSLNHAKYFTGLIRAMGDESSTHFDFAPHQLPGWSVADAVAQFAVVTYLQMPYSGGGLTIYNRPWEQKDEANNNDIDEKGPRGFDQQFLEDEQSVTIVPNAGEMIVFNSRNFHKVEGIVSKIARYSINSFMSLSDDKLLFWN